MLDDCLAKGNKRKEPTNGVVFGRMEDQEGSNKVKKL